jgi:CheY-like chemotaxis protein
MNNKQRNPISLIIADDDQEDCLLAADALKEARLVNDLHIVADGEELLDYLCRQGKYTDKRISPTPSLIMIDLNMPKKDGREAIKEIKSNPKLRHLPIVVLTTSKAEEDIYRSYELGVNSYITKPVTFEALVDVIQTIGKYWFEIVELPPQRNGD